MKNALLLLVLLTGLLMQTASAQVMEGRELVMLDSSTTVHEIAINSNVATTITFPEPVTLLTGYGLVSEAGAANAMAQANVCVVHYDNTLPDTIVVRLIKAGEPCHATVRTTSAMHLLRFISSPSANLAVIVSPPGQRSAAREIDPNDVTHKRLNMSADELVGMLGKARNRKALQPLNPTLYTGWEERNSLDLTSTVKNRTSTIYEIQRWPAKDALVFRCWITNIGDTPYEFEPNGVKVRIGERSYPVQLADCSGLVQPNQKMPLDVILQGNIQGGREHLSINQDFRIELPEEGRQPSAALFGDASASDFDGK
ncbi:MAG: hypothetical protein ABL974_23710 [Prosthecobacter sp.]